MAAPAVDVRRFRTWDAEPAVSAQPGWRILARYGYVQLASNWGGRSLLVLLSVFIVTTVGGASYGMASGAGVHFGAWGGTLMVALWPLAILLLVVGGPLFAEDLRFNAPLFYFSKPLRPAQYMAGKVTFLSSLVGGAVLAPVVLTSLLALAVGVPSTREPQLDGRYWTPAEREERLRVWRMEHIDSVGDWVTAFFATLPAFLLLTAMLVAVMVACSLHTRRGWHASTAFVAIVGGLGLAGVVLADSGSTALAHTGGPFGWAYLMLLLPLQLAFSEPTHPFEARALENAGTAIAIAYVLCIAVTAIAAAASLRRIRTQEARS